MHRGGALVLFHGERDIKRFAYVPDGVLFPHVGDHHPQLRYLPAQFPQQILGETKPLKLSQHIQVFNDAVSFRGKAAELSEAERVYFGAAFQRVSDTFPYRCFLFSASILVLFPR